MTATGAARARALASCWLALAFAQDVHAADVATSLAHALWLGAPRGPASAREVDASGTLRSPALPDPGAAHVAWQRNLSAGASGNLLVDATGRIFVPGQQRVTELDRDGSPRYELTAPVSGCVAAALLADDTRMLLTREGRLLGWNEAGASVFEAELPVPPPTAASALVPLSDGGLLVATGRWLFAFDASRGTPLHVTLPAAVALARQVGERSLVVDDRGRVFDARRGAEARLLGAFSAPVSAALGDGELLVALTTARTLEALDPADGRSRELARFEAPGPLPLLALSEPGSWVTLGPEGDWMLLGSLAPAPTASLRPRKDATNGIRDPQLLVDPRGVVARWAANRPLVLGNLDGTERELPEVRCSDPVALAPAGSGRLVAACSSGALWSIASASALPSHP